MYKDIPMSKTLQEIALKNRYRTDIVMSRLLECNQNIRCINYSLKYYGSADLTLEEIGLVLGVTRERVRQIEASALKKLRHPKIGRLLRSYMEL